MQQNGSRLWNRTNSNLPLYKLEQFELLAGKFLGDISLTIKVYLLVTSNIKVVSHLKRDLGLCSLSFSGTRHGGSALLKRYFQGCGIIMSTLIGGTRERMQKELLILHHLGLQVAVAVLLPRTQGGRKYSLCQDSW